MNDVAYNEAWLSERAREVRATIDAIRDIGGQLDDRQLGWRPPDGGWSVAQVFEHLIITDTSYLAALRRMLSRGVRGDSHYRPTLAGRLLIRSLQPASRWRVKTPRIWRPAAAARAGVVAEYLDLRAQVLQLIEGARGLDLRRNRMASPASRLIRVNLGDAITILVVHTQRHLAQVGRIRTYSGFPERGNAR